MANVASGVATAPAGATYCQVSPFLSREPKPDSMHHLPSQPKGPLIRVICILLKHRKKNWKEIDQNVTCLPVD